MRYLVFLISLILLSLPLNGNALEPGTLLYRTSSEGKIYGKNADYLMESSYGVANKVNSGHVGIYVGKIDGLDYVVEALGDGIVKTPAAFFVNLEEGEEFLGAKIPYLASPWQRAKAVSIAKSLAERDLAYDINFREQKGPLSGQWTCVGLAEKIYESANALYPERLSALEYDQEKYAVDITKDAFDNFSVYNSQGDVFSTIFEFSKINRQKNTILPAPELIGYNAGKEVAGERYIFLPYTQFLQNSLKEQKLDIELSSYFKASDIRGKSSNFKTAVAWSLINNPVSSLKIIINNISSLFKGKTTEEKVAEIDKRDLERQEIVLEQYEENLDEEEAEIKELENEAELVEELSLLISKISAEGLDDYLEIYNYGSKDINLGQENIRLHKAYQSANFPIILRFNNEADYHLKTDLIIKAQSSFLIVRDKASPKLKEKADLIALRSAFSWTGNGYSLYLASGPVSNDSDEDIIDQVGFGTAKYYQQKPALEILDNHILVRKTMEGRSKDNFDDFKLLRIKEEEIIEEELIIKEEEKEEKLIENKIQEVLRVDKEINTVHLLPESKEEEEEEDVEEIISESEKELSLLIEEISAQDLDDYLILYNYGDLDIDLVEEKIRLHKAYQSANFPIIIRFDNQSDVLFQTDTSIKAKSSYLIARQKASPEIKDRADAIALRSSFNWTKSGYSLYLASGPVSSDSDEDIIDQVGFGTAKYYQEKPALEILDNHILVRKSSLGRSFNNFTDFKLLRVREEEIIEDDEDEEEEEEIIEDEDEEEEEEIIEEEEEEIVEEDEEEELVDLTLLISRVSAEGKNDFVEIFNYGDKDIDLEEQAIRLHKVYQSENYPILIRFDKNEDALYPSGRLIKAQSPYLIVRNMADDKWLSQADAIALRSEFTWSGSGYTLYLASNTVSSDEDEDIIDKIGFGEAQYYYNQAAPEILEGQALRRKALATTSLEDIIAGGQHEKLLTIYDSKNNFFDFLLWPLTNVLPVNYQSVLVPDYSPPGFAPYSAAESLEIADIAHLWHFDDCHGNLAIDELSRFTPNPLYITSNGPWLSNFWGCSRHLDGDLEAFSFELPEIIDGNQFALSFMYKAKDDYSRITTRFFGNEEERELNVRFFSHQTEFNSGFPGVTGRIRHDPYLVNENWQRMLISFNKLAEDSHAWYLEVNGNQVFSHIFNGLLPSYSNFQLLADSGRVDFDEVALWHRGLTSEERGALAEFKPLSPATYFEAQNQPALKYAWLFDQAQGTTSSASVGNLDLEIDFNALVVDGKRENALRSSQFYSHVIEDLNPTIKGGEMSLSFWWKNSSYPDNSFTYLILSEDEADHFGLRIEGSSVAYIFQQKEGALCSYDFADTWHHLALSYDKYLHTLSFYINGEPCFSQQFIPYLAPEPELNKLKIFSSIGQSDFDELKIWEGSLQADQVAFEHSLSE